MKRKNIIFISSISVLIAFLLVGIFADFLAPYDPNQVDMLNGLAGPSTEHWLGTDHLGRDLLSRLIYGSRFICIYCFFCYRMYAAPGAGNWIAIWFILEVGLIKRYSLL